MGLKSRVDAAEQDPFRIELGNLIYQRHELVKLASLIDWPAFVKAWGRSSSPPPAARRWTRG